ncbi:MAG: TOTE conflict system archaeo-eukaryotic primase domain-containing protein [Spartobacteria bacterium]
MNESTDRIAAIESELQGLEFRRQGLLAELREIRSREKAPELPLGRGTPGTNEEKIDLFLSLFGARRSVYPKLWINTKKGSKGYSPACGNEWVGGLCKKPHVKCSNCPNQNFPPLDHSAIHSHLTGRHTIGTYAIREDDSCIFLAADFDGDGWMQDIDAYRRAAEQMGISVGVERSRSGNGGHAWIFFTNPVPAELARRLGTLIVARASSFHQGMKLSTYDRFFPNQDICPKGGFGNLIALPLQQDPRKSGNTLFLDEHFEPVSDQWGYLAGFPKIDTVELQRLLAACRPEKDNEPTESAAMVFDETALNVIPQAVRRGDFKGTLELNRHSQITIPLTDLPTTLGAALKRLGTIANPIFYEKQRLRFPTVNIPRFIFCGEQNDDRLVLPRGTLHDIEKLVSKAGGKVEVVDRRPTPAKIDLKFIGNLTTTQSAAADAMLKHEEGVLVAPQGAGKTVMACAAIARRSTPTLVLVHRKQLLDQWNERLQKFLGLSKNEIHVLGKARNPDAPVALGMFPTLARSEFPEALLARYGHVVIDECHHVPAASFEAAMKRCSARYILGLAATPNRKDGLQKILFLQCGPIRHRIDLDHSGEQSRTVLVREFSLRLPSEKERLPIHQIWEHLIQSSERNRAIASDVSTALEEQRFCALLSDRKEHLNALESLLLEKIPANLIYRIDGSTNQKLRTAILANLHSKATKGEPFALLATSSLLGEGFDMPELDTLFLAMPISFKGRLIQYAGRLHRFSEKKKSVRIYDYVEPDHPLTSQMYRKRTAAYREMGYSIQIVGSDEKNCSTAPVDNAEESNIFRSVEEDVGLDR